MLRKLLRVLGIVLAAAIVIGAALLLYLEPYVTYDRDGAHLSLNKNAQDPDGTGATAAAIVTNFACQPAVLRYDVAVPGGTLSVRFSREAATEHYSDIRLTGPARRVFAGEFGTEDF